MKAKNSKKIGQKIKNSIEKLNLKKLEVSEKSLLRAILFFTIFYFVFETITVSGLSPKQLIIEESN